MDETDLIRRQAAIKILRESEEYDADIPNRADGVRDAIIDIMSLPTIEERKGKWIVDDVATEHCSVCKHRFYISALFAVGGNDETPCCPWCGARMGEEHDE